MPKRITVYQYKPNDTPVSVAAQYGITPQQLLSANSGGAPFSAGQTIQIPHYRPPPQPPNFLQSLVGYDPNRPVQQTTQYPVMDALGRNIKLAQYSVSKALQTAVGLRPFVQSGSLDERGNPDYRSAGYSGNASNPDYRSAGYSGQSAPQQQIQQGNIPYWQLAAQSVSNNIGSGDYMGGHRDMETTHAIQFLANGSLPTTLTKQQVQQMKANGMDVSAVAMYYSMGSDGNFKINSTGQEAANSPTIPQYGANDPLKGTHGHYYVDADTEKFVNKVITVNGRSRLLRMSDDGKLWYQKIGQNRRGRAVNRQRQAQAAAVQYAAKQAAAAPVVEPEVFSIANDFTSFNVAGG